MVDSGILACGNGFDEAACVVKIIECSISGLMLLLIIFVLIQRLRIQCRLSFYLFISLSMGAALTFVIVNTLDSDTKMFLFLAGYSYNVYFSIIVLKVGLKLLQIIRPNINYEKYRKTVISIFVIYQVLLISALTYSVIQRDKQCFAMPFLVTNIVGLATAVIFLLIGIRHSRQQEQRLDLSLSRNKLRNPLPKFQCWIITNFIGQVMVLIQSIVFQINTCQFSSQQLINDICRMVFEFLSFHIGISSSIYFFHLVNLTQIKQRTRTDTLGDSTPAHIELVYQQNDTEQENRHKNLSL